MVKLYASARFDLIWSSKLLVLQVQTRVMYDYGKGFSLNSAFLTVEQEISRLGKFKIILHFPATKMCLFVFLFSFLNFLHNDILKAKYMQNIVQKHVKIRCFGPYAKQEDYFCDQNQVWNDVNDCSPLSNPYI